MIRFTPWASKNTLRGLGKHRGVRYAASLPERVVRSASALAAGTVREVAAVALPIGFRRGRLYRSLVDVTLQFLIEDVGGVQAAQPESSRSSARTSCCAVQPATASSSWA